MSRLQVYEGWSQPKILQKNLKVRLLLQQHKYISFPTTHGPKFRKFEIETIYSTLIDVSVITNMYERETHDAKSE